MTAGAASLERLPAKWRDRVRPDLADDPHALRRALAESRGDPILHGVLLLVAMGRRLAEADIARALMARLRVVVAAERSRYPHAAPAPQLPRELAQAARCGLLRLPPPTHGERVARLRDREVRTAST